MVLQAILQPVAGAPLLLSPVDSRNERTTSAFHGLDFPRDEVPYRCGDFAGMAIREQTMRLDDASPPGRHAGERLVQTLRN